MGLRNHLVTMHTNQAEHQRDCAKAHEVFHKTLEDGPEKEFHKTMRDSHIAHAEKCVACARSASALDDSISTGDLHGPKVMKLALGADRFDAVVPDNVFLVPRFGSPTEAELQKAAEGGEVPAAVRHMFERRPSGGQ